MAMTSTLSPPDVDLLDLDVLQLRESLGATRFGSAEQAVDIRTGKNVVLSRVELSKLERERDDAAQWLADVRRLPEIRVAGVTTLRDLRSEDRDLLLVFEPPPGRPLSELLEQGETVDRATLIAWAMRLLDLLGPLHERGVLHRNLGLAAVRIGDDGELSLAEVGLTSLAADPTCIQAPEVEWGEPATPSSDLYALGALLRKVAWAAPSPLLGSSADDPLTQVLRISAEVPDRRFATAQEMRQALQAAVVGGRGKVIRPPVRDSASTAATMVLDRRQLLTDLAAGAAEVAESAGGEIPAEPVLEDEPGERPEPPWAMDPVTPAERGFAYSTDRGRGERVAGWLLGGALLLLLLGLGWLVLAGPA